MSDGCNCFDIEAEVMMDEPKIDGELDFIGEVIFASDGEDYKRGYEEGHAQGLIDGRADGYQSGYDEGHKVGSESGYSQGKQDGLTEGYNNGYAQGKADGYKDGYNEGYSKGYEQGVIDTAKEEQEKTVKITENGTTEITPDENKVLSKVTVEVDVESGGSTDSYYDTFWDGTQQNGQRTDYEHWARNKVFTADNFYPKYDIIPVKTTSMFQHSGLNIDLEQRLQECGVVLDFSKTTGGMDVFQNSAFTVLPVIDCSSATSMQNWFYSAYSLHTIRLIRVHSGITSYYNAFSACTFLQEVRFEGEVAASINFGSCSQLSMDSVDSIGACCIDLTGQDSKTVTFHKNVIAKMLDEQKAVFTNKNWTIASKG